MQSRDQTPPFLFFFLDLPAGISSGFASIILGFVLAQAGFSVATIGAIVSFGVSANVWRFLWGPLADFTFSPRFWYLFGLIVSSATLLLLGFIPLRPGALAIVYAVTFISQVASTFIMLPQGGMMAHTVAEQAKGRASGWYQAGNLGGNGIGGGAGVWLAAHFSKEVAAISLAAVMLACAVAVFFVTNVRIVTAEGFGLRMRALWVDLLSLLTAAIPLFITVMVCSPIGAGVMGNLWSAVASDWNASADMVALVTGVLNGVVAAVGCLLGGWIADRVGVWWAYFGSGIAIAAVAMVMAFAARTPGAFSIGVLAYAFMNGVAYAAFSALVLVAIGRGAASTKYALLCSIGNIPVWYMGVIDGWAHDRFGSAAMLQVDAWSGLIVIAFGLLGLLLIRRRQTVAIQP